MNNYLIIIPIFFIFLLFVFLSFVFLYEGEKRPAIISLISGIILSIPPALFGYFFAHNDFLAFLPGMVYLFAIVVFLIPWRRYQINLPGNPSFRFDERQIMFSRAELEMGTEQFENYYEQHPEHKILDDKFRQKPGLLGNNSQKFNHLIFSATRANFEAVLFYKRALTDQYNENTTNRTDAHLLTGFIKKWAKKAGVSSLGICRLKDTHLYSHKGRGKEYGKEIVRKHEFAIAFTVEMDKQMIDRAPEAETVLESSQQYLNAATFAGQLSLFIRNLGYSARPHFDGNYEVICPLVARDAGLGEIGRMGLLMTPHLGPRVRIGVVTTSLPLATNQYIPDLSVLDFCTRCKKCAENCPAGAISFSDAVKDDTMCRWTIKHEACFTYWCVIGTDCGKCIQVCPYSHPDNLLHGFIRKGIKNSGLFSSIAIKMDDLFYGRRPNLKNYKSPVL